MRERIRSIFLCLLLVVSIFTIIEITTEFVGVVRGATLYVNETGVGAYDKIQDAIDNASVGNTVYVYNGTYYENVIVSKTINLTGMDMKTTIIDGGGSGDIVYVSSNYVNITGFTMLNSGTNSAGIQLDSVNMCRLMNNNLSDNYYGIHLTMSANNDINNNTCFMDERGIYLENSDNNTLFNNNLLENTISTGSGIRLSVSSNNTIINNNLYSNLGWGITIYRASKNNITNNSISTNNRGGLLIDDSTDTLVTSNEFINNGIYLDGNQMRYYNTHNISTDNVINGKPIYYYKNSSGIIIDGIPIGQLILANCSAFEIKNLQINNTEYAILAAFSTFNNISKNNIFNNYCGIRLSYSNDNNITNNDIYNNSNGLYIYRYYGNRIIGNNITYNSNNGIYTWVSANNNFSNNNISYNYYGIYVAAFSDGNVILNNTVVSNGRTGITLSSTCEDNTIADNYVYSNNYRGISLAISTLNRIYHNMIIDNVNQAFDNSGSGNQWDDDYPSGGNYWSDYTGLDDNGDGIGDTPYTDIQGSVGPQDRYPLMEPIPDTLPPRIQLISPDNNSMVSPGTILDFSIYDGHLNYTNYSIDGGPEQSFLPQFDISTVAWSDGPHFVIITAQDNNSNFASKSFNFTVDSIFPIINLNSPTNNSIITPGAILDFSIIESNLDEVNYSINGGINVSLPDPFDISTVGWSDGNYTIQINAVDLAGNSKTELYFFTIDANPPQIILNSPGNNSVIQSGTILDFSIIDPLLSNVNYSVDGGPELVLSPPFDISTSGWTDGGHTVQIIAEDTLGNSNSSWFYITIDDIKPTINLNSPLNNSIVPIGTLLDFFISDSNLLQVNYSINGSSTIGFPSPFDISTISWIEGNYTILINALDMAGNFISSWYFITLQGSLGDSPYLSEPKVTPDFGSINDIFNYSVVYTGPAGTPDIINLSIDGINYTMENYTLYLAPNGSDFHVNTYIFNEQEDPAIAVYPNGSFVVVWSSWQGMGLWGIYGQRYYSNGTKLGGEFEIEDVASEWDQHPDIAINPATNDFVVVWDTTDPFPYQHIYMKIFNSDGTPKTSSIMVNTYTTSYQDEPAVACSSNGNIVVAWNSWEQDGSYYGVYGQRFDSNGNPLGSEFRVNTFTDSWQAFPDVVCLSNDRFIIVWMSYSIDAIFGQKYFSNGNTWGSEFRVSSTNGWYEQNPSIARDASNNFIVVWKSTARSSGEEGIYFQRYFASGSVMGSETMVVAAPNSEWAETDVVCTSDDDYLITWDANNQETGDWDVYLQKLGSDGIKIGETLRVSENYTNDQKHSKIGIDSNDKFVAVWQSFDMSDDSDFGIYGRRFLNITSRKYYYTTNLSHGLHTYQFFADEDSDIINTSLLVGPYVDYPPTLTNPAVTPSAGSTSTMFNYTITYTDLDNDPPSFMKIEIDGSEYMMFEVDPTDVDYTDGKEFYYTTTISSGSHDYQFFTSDGTSEVNTTLFMGPVIDDVPPITSIDISEPKEGADPAYVNIDTMFTLTHNNDSGGSGVAFTWYTIDSEYFEGTSFNLTGYSDGPYNITWGSTDNVSNNETGNFVNVSLDTEPPTTTLDIGEPKVRDSTFDFWNVTPSTQFTLNSSDTSSGVDFTWYTIDGNYYEGSSFNLGGYIDGPHVITYGASDNVGNNIMENTTTVYLDTQSPITDLNVGSPRFRENPGDLWNVTDTSMFTLTSSDQFSGVNFTWYTIDGEYFEGTSFNLLGRSEGYHNISWGSVDYLGYNETGNLMAVNVDITPPATNISLGMPRFRSQVTDLWNVTTSTEFSISGNDSPQGSGINFKWYSIDGIFHVYSSPFNLSSGEHIITWGAIDNVGLNETGNVLSVFVDVEAPVTEIQEGSLKYRQNAGDDWNITEATTFTLDSEDQLSGVAVIWYKIDGEYFEGTVFTLFGYSDGLYTISWGAVDNLGNNETGNLIQVYLDTAAPLTSLNIDNPKYRNLDTHNWNVTTDTEFSLSLTDLHSGVNKSWYYIDAQYFEGTDFDLSGFSEGSHIITWGSIDNLANNETGNSIIVILDNTPPSTEIEINTPKYRADEMYYWNVTDTTEFQLSSYDQSSGVDITRYSIDGEYYEGTHFYISGYTDGLHTITWESVDNLGNAETVNVLVVNLDTTPPSISVKIGSPNSTFQGNLHISTSTPITLESSDWGVGETTIYYSLDGGMKYSIYESSFTVSSTTTSIVYYGEDALGNGVEVTGVYVTVDYIDSDGDEIPDFEDSDDDGDGYPDSEDDFPLDANEWVDTDSDGIGNNADLDDDNDGLYDEEDLDPLDPTIGKEQVDSQPEDSNWLLYIILMIIILLIVVIALILVKRRSGISEEEPPIEKPKPKVEEAPLKKVTEEKPKITTKPKQPPQQKTEEKLPPPPPKTEELPPPPPPPPPPPDS